jgi:hypothetical protein
MYLKVVLYSDNVRYSVLNHDFMIDFLALPRFSAMAIHPTSSAVCAILPAAAF